MSDLKLHPTLLKQISDYEADLAFSSIARIKQCNEDTQQLIAGARRELTTSYALLAEINRILTRR